MWPTIKYLQNILLNIKIFNFEGIFFFCYWYLYLIFDNLISENDSKLSKEESFWQDYLTIKTFNNLLYIFEIYWKYSFHCIQYFLLCIRKNINFIYIYKRLETWVSSIEFLEYLQDFRNSSLSHINFLLDCGNGSIFAS